MKLPAFINPKAISTELAAIVIAALIFAWAQRNVPALRELLKTTPRP